MSIGQRIRELRGQTGISQQDLAKEIGVSRGNVGDWEVGKAKPGADALIAITKHFNVSADWVLEGKDFLDTRISERTAESEYSPSDIELFLKIQQLTEREKGRVEGTIDEILRNRKEQEQDLNRGKEGRSSTSLNGQKGEDETSAGKQVG